MTLPILTSIWAWLAFGTAFLAARTILRRRVVFLLGRHGQEVAPGVVASLWLGGFLLGQLTGSILGMMWVAAAVLVVAAAVVHRGGFALQQGRHRLFTRLDLLILVYFAILFLFVGHWDFETRHIMVAQLLHGNLPPVALNDPRVPMTYHPTYDALTAVVLMLLPIDLEPAMAVVSVSCVVLTLANLRSITRLLFRTPVAAQLGRFLYAFGYGPVFIRYLQENRDTEVLHGATSQVYVDIILRRPAGLGFAFFTLALALILPVYRGWRARVVVPKAAAGEGGGESLPAATPPLDAGEADARRRAIRALIFLLPTCALQPQLAEETMLFLTVLLLPLVLTRRLPRNLVIALIVAGAIGALRSGVLRGVLNVSTTMAAPHPHFSWPPALPSWKSPDDGVPLFSRLGFNFFFIELGPVFLAALGWALAGGVGERGRVLAAIFFAGLATVLVTKPTGWPKSDLDRFLFYGTPSIFMLSAGLLERFWLRGPRRRTGEIRPPRSRPVVLSTAVGFAIIVCSAPLVFPNVKAIPVLVDSFNRHELRGDLAVKLRAVGRRDLVLTARERNRDLLRAGFLVLAPFETSSVVGVTEDHLDDYVRKNEARANWLFLPENDPRVAGQPVVSRDGSFVLVRAKPAPGSTVATGSGH